MMIEGIRRALDFPHDERRLRFVTFLTDGYIGNEVEILRELKQSARPQPDLQLRRRVLHEPLPARQHGQAGQRRGRVLGLNDDAERVMSDFFQRISHPALTDLTISFDGAQVSDVFPRTMPDLFVGRPIVITDGSRERAQACAHSSANRKLGAIVRRRP
jgi:Ca-activated chloride channel family protein